MQAEKVALAQATPAWEMEIITITGQSLIFCTVFIF
jgi:hypothetical protein